MDEQSNAAFHGKGAACIIAGAGTGKTTTLVKRIEFLTKQAKIPANKILITTFTRKATAELYSRCVEKLGDDAHQLKITTIDAAILDFSKEAVHFGLISPFRLLDEAGQRILLLYCAQEILKEIVPSKSHNDSRFPSFYSKSHYEKQYYSNPRNAKKVYGLSKYGKDDKSKEALVNLLQLYVREKKMNSTKEKQVINEKISRQIESINNGYGIPFIQYSDKKKMGGKHMRWYVDDYSLNKVTKKYFEEIKQLGVKDYDIISEEFLSCLQKNKSFAKNISSKFSTILVDEFQDTSRTQAEILLLLSGIKKSIWAVGDPCQQIYEWRGAGVDNFEWFIKTTKASKYHLTNNYRSTQTILDGAYNFLNKKVPQLTSEKFLSKLKSNRSEKDKTVDNPIYSGDLSKALYLVKQLLASNPSLKPSDIVILSRDLTSKTIIEIEKKASQNGLKIQLHSTRADRVMKNTIGSPVNWEAGEALIGLYSHTQIKRQIAKSLLRRDFSELRIIRSLTNVAETFDSILPANTFTFKEAWPVLQKTQHREVAVSAAVTETFDKIQVMTIHAAKGLEFPVVLLMTLGKKFPKPYHKNDKEVFRLVYVGVTRAKDLCILVHTPQKPISLLKDFGTVTGISNSKKGERNINLQSKKKEQLPPLIAATHLEINEQCPLKFAAYHEGLYLPTWSQEQSMGSRIHKALEYYLHKGLPTKKDIIKDCFNEGYLDGDSPVRKISPVNKEKIKKAFETITSHLSKKYKRVVAIEQKYRYVNNNGQVEGVVDAILERKKDGAFILKEWKNTKLLSKNNRAYELQARAGALGIHNQKLHRIDKIEIVPLLSANISKDTIKFSFNDSFIDESKNILDKVFIDLKARNYSTKKGEHCKLCQLKPHCPAHTKK